MSDQPSRRFTVQGLGDRLNELGYFTVLFNASKKCRHEKAREVFANEKARVHYQFREMLIAGEIGIPADEMLLQELRVVSGFTNQSGKLQIVAKDDLRVILGHPTAPTPLSRRCAGRIRSISAG